MKTTINEINGKLVATFEGELDTAAAIEVEKAKSDNWEKSYNTIKKDNETCAQMLSTSIGVNEKKKEKEDQDRRSAAMATSSSFLGGFGVGMLVMWLIMK